MNTGGGIAYQPDIDGLRAIAVLAVVGFHAFPGHFPGGFLGVDIFFVISGYLITSLLLREREASGAIDIGQFYIRRIRRLFPALLLVIFATLVAGYALLFAHEFARLARHAWASLFFVENILLATESGYFDVDAYDKPLLHFWSLAVEEQFYLVWPLLLALFARNTRQVGLLIGFAVAASLVVTFAGILDGAWHFYSPATRVWELGAGAGLGWWAARRGDTAAHVQPVLEALLALFALGGIAAAVLFGSESWHHPGLLTMVPVLATVLLIALGGETAVNRRLLAWRPAVAIGLISYPLYLWHWPLLSYLAIVSDEERGPTLLRLTAVGIAIALAAATYWLVERPLRFRVPARRAVAGLVVTAFGIVLAVGALLSWRPADSDRVQAIAQQQLEGVAWRWMTDDTCREEHGSDFTNFCVQNRPGRPDILLFGNSYVNHLYPGLAQSDVFGGSTIADFGTCEVSRSLPEINDNCDAQWDLLKGLDDNSLVIVSSQWPLFDGEGKMTDLRAGDLGRPGEYPDLAHYSAALSRQIGQLADLGHTVVLVGPKPELGYDMADCYPRPLANVTRDCRAQRADYLAAAAPTLALLQGIAERHSNVYFFDLANVFCGESRCDYRSAEGYPLLRDGNGHLSELGSRLAARRLAAWMRQKNIPFP